jgi:hypothetical protein
VSTPAEPYSRFQMELREMFGNAAIAVLNASNGCLNYLPTPEAYDRGTYEATVALYDKGSLEDIIRLAAGAIQQLN